MSEAKREFFSAQALLGTHCVLGTWVSVLGPLEQRPHARWPLTAATWSPTVLEATNLRSRCGQGHSLSEGSRGGPFLPSSGGSRPRPSVPAKPCVSVSTRLQSYEDTRHWVREGHPPILQDDLLVTN